MNDLLCDACGRRFPSEHWFRTPGICVECFGKLPEQGREELIRQRHPDSLVSGTEAEKKPSQKFTWKTALGMIVGTVLGQYSKINALIPAVTVGLSTWLLSKVLKGRRLQVAKVAGALVGYSLWILIGLFDGLYLEVAVEVVLVGAVLVFLLVRPSRESLSVAAAWLTLAALVNLHQLLTTAFGSGVHRALVIHIALRFYSLYLIFEAWQALSRPETVQSDASSIVA